MLVYDLATFALFYLAVVFVYGIVGVILFGNDLPEFTYIWSAMFTLFRASIKNYDYSKI
jgi:hypothetical protein